MWYRFCKDVELEENNIPYKSWEDLEQEAKQKEEKIKQEREQERERKIYEATWLQKKELEDIELLDEVWQKLNHSPSEAIYVLKKIMDNSPRNYSSFPNYLSTLDDEGLWRPLKTEKGHREANELLRTLKLLENNLEQQALEPKIEENVKLKKNDTKKNDNWKKILDSDGEELAKFVYSNVLNMSLPEIPKISGKTWYEVYDFEAKMVELYFSELKKNVYNSVEEIHEFYKIPRKTPFSPEIEELLKKIRGGYREVCHRLSHEAYNNTPRFTRSFDLLSTDGFKEFHKFMSRKIYEIYKEGYKEKTSRWVTRYEPHVTLV